MLKYTHTHAHIHAQMHNIQSHTITNVLQNQFGTPVFLFTNIKEAKVYKIWLFVITNIIQCLVRIRQLQH